MNRHIVPDEVLTAVEPLDEAIVDARVPGTPFAFIWFLVKTHFVRRVLLLVGIALAAATVDAFAPLGFSHLVNGVLHARSAHLAFTTVLPWVGLIAGLWLGAGLAYRGYEAMDIGTSPRLRALAQKYLFAYMLGHAPRYFQDNFAGKLGQKIKQAGQAVITILTIICFEMVRVTGSVLLGAVLMFLAQPVYALILGVWTALYLTIVITLARRCVRLSKAFSDEVSTSTGRLVDAISNADLIRAFAKAAYERRFLSHFLADEMNASRRLRRFLVAMRAFMHLATTVFMLTLVLVTARDWYLGATSAGTFVMVYLLGNQIARGVQELSFRMLDYFEQVGTLAEALELVSQSHEIVDVPGARPLCVTQGAIRFEHIRFAHRDGGAVFDGLNLEIKAGEKVGLVGPSGAGKSTLVKLLRRQYEPQAGAILIDGQDIARISWDSLNEAIAEVPQSPGVFHRAIRDNIRYAQADAPESVVIRAARDAHAHDFILSREEGYSTIVGEQGIKLSGGERQRVAIARALVKDARILVLDEATSSLDSESEHMIQEALWTLMQGRTVIAIAHRLSTIAGMDRVVYLEHGRIVEDGAHKVLLAKGGAYARLWNRQMGGFLEAG
ncbi:MAG: ABC transporter ATP-binding protein [Alphaproteobacteria bacterium]|nr:ABC transporter ATP-binding protein [Alphaproteobacteria bacterium]